MHPDIHALYCVYNDDTHLEESLQATQEFADRIVVLDGAWAMRPGAEQEPCSTDDTLAIARQYADKVITRDMPWADEATARQRLLQEVPKGDWAFRIDADEVVTEFDHEPFERDEHVLMPLFRTHKKDGTVNEHHSHAIFRQTPGLWYSHLDNLMIEREELPKFVTDDSMTEKIVIDHYRYDRPDDRLQNRLEYRRRVSQEGSI